MRDPIIPTNIKLVIVQIHFDRLKRPFSPSDTMRVAGIAGAADKCPHGSVIQCKHTTETSLDISFGTESPAALWEWLKPFLKEMKVLKGSIVVCQGDYGWDDYLLLHHFDPDETLDIIQE